MISAGRSVSCGKVNQPFFTIAVTTYNRKELLRDSLSSILGQTFDDFEVLVGNDYVGERLTVGMLGIDDPRIRIFNHETNLGQVENINRMLKNARGHYFTWLSDDDLYGRDFLRFVYAVLEETNMAPCVYTGFEVVRNTTVPDADSDALSRIQVFGGARFLRSYLDAKISVMGWNGVFDTKQFRELGGMESLSEARVGLYGEYMLLVRLGLWDKIGYTDAPLVFYRAHGGAWSGANVEVQRYVEAGANLVRNCVEVMTQPQLRPDFRENIFAILCLVVANYVGKQRMKDGFVSARRLISFLRILAGQFETMRGTSLYISAMWSLGQVGWSPLHKAMKADLRKRLPAPMVRSIRWLRRLLRVASGWIVSAMPDSWRPTARRWFADRRGKRPVQFWG